MSPQRVLYFYTVLAEEACGKPGVVAERLIELRCPILEKGPRPNLLFIWCWQEESNLRPTDYESVALPTELRQRGRDCTCHRARRQESSAYDQDAIPSASSGNASRRWIKKPLR